MLKKKPTTVGEYIAEAPAWSKNTLKELRRTIKAAAPSAKESISYRMPYYSQHGRLAYFAAFKNHCSFFWISASDKKVFAKEFASQKVVGSTLQIPQGKKVPVTLIKKLVKTRVKSNMAEERYYEQKRNRN